MEIVLAGGSGFLGQALQQQLQRDGHSVRVLTRRAQVATDVAWQPDGTAGPWAQALDGADAVVNLAGANLAAGRWTASRKRILRDSRLLATRSLTAGIRQAAHPPGVFLSASGAGYYGDRGADVMTEDAPAGSDFLAQLCVEWEHEAEQAATATRVVLLRSAVVLHPSGGALGKMLPPFRLGLGGRLGAGTQYFPWIHRDDWVALVRWLIATAAARGAFNLAAPGAITNAEFTQALARAVHRPAVIPVPAFALKAAFGELALTLLTGQRVIPARAQEMGFACRFPQIEDALRDLLP